MRGLIYFTRIHFSMSWVVALVLTFSVLTPTNPSFAQTADSTVSGRIIDQIGVGIIGASVSVKGTSLGTTTDMAGKFAISIPSDAVLVISSVGYQAQEIAVARLEKKKLKLR